MIRACHVDDIPLGEGRACTIAGRRIAVFRTPTGWYAIDDACPHAAGPLADGIASDCSVICTSAASRWTAARRSATRAAASPRTGSRCAVTRCSWRWPPRRSRSRPDASYTDA
jgi:nitrite reductase/ring-hydroxylating ferredoxin subunit